MKHLKEQGQWIGRQDAFADLPFLRPTQPLSKLAGKAPPPAAPVGDKLDDFITNLKRNEANRPKKEKTLCTNRASHFGDKLTEAQTDAKLIELKQRTGITVEPKGIISYG